MTTYNTSVKFPKLNFDDCIQHENRKVQLTHYDTDHKTPLFLQFVNDVAQPCYCIGFANAIKWLKTGILESPKLKVKTSKARLNDKQLIVKTWKTANGGTDFQLNFDGQDLTLLEFEMQAFPELSDSACSCLHLFSPWCRWLFQPVFFDSLPVSDRTAEAEKHFFPSTFDVLHWNLASHIVSRVNVVKTFISSREK